MLILIKLCWIYFLEAKKKMIKVEKLIISSWEKYDYCLRFDFSDKFKIFCNKTFFKN